MNTIEEKPRINYSNNKKEQQNQLTIPIEFQNQSFPSYLSLSDDNNNNLYININQNHEDILDEITKINKLLEEKNTTIKNFQNSIDNNKKETNQINQKISKLEKELLSEKKNVESQKIKINELNSSINEINSYINNPKKEKNLESNYLKLKFSNVPYSEKYVIESLQKDLTDYQLYIEEIISHKKPIITEILTELQNCVNEINPNYKVNLYGSYCTGLCLPWSDIDTVISYSQGHYEEFFLSKLYIKLTTKNWVKSHLFIENTNVPIIKLVSNDKFNFHIDISIQNESHFGLKTVELIKSYLDNYIVLKPIILALKTLLNNSNLNNPYTGGLSSYGLILMVVSFIQSQIDSKKYDNNSPNILGETFLNVLGHYGIFFDYNKFIIISYPIGPIQEDDNEIEFPFNNTNELIIVDPLNKQNNVAKSTFHFMNIKMVFMIAYMVAKEDCECGCHYHNIFNNKMLSTEHCILKRIFSSVKRFEESNNIFYNK